jgi:hypothetical protein
MTLDLNNSSSDSRSFNKQPFAFYYIQFEQELFQLSGAEGQFFKICDFQDGHRYHGNGSHDCSFTFIF